MELDLHRGEYVRLKTYSGPFMDVKHVGYESLASTFFGFKGYIEIRKKDEQVCVFQFPKKSLKKECDFGWWEDAEVVFSFNVNGKDSK